MDNNTVYQWILQQFTVSARAKGLQTVLSPYLSTYVRSEDRVLDLCCGSGAMSFWFEEQGAEVIGMDIAPYMLALAQDEARNRNSLVNFIEADIHKQDFGNERYDLISCFGNSITDFPLSDFMRLGNKVATALRVGGRFFVQYHDDSFRYLRRDAIWEGVYQETPERITYRFKEYLPELGAFVKIIQNETLGEEYQRTGYIYTVPAVQLVMNNFLCLEQHFVLAEDHFLDIFIKKSEGSR